jgi:hypothetical protein
MCVYIGIEDLAANALIELLEKDNSNTKVSFKALEDYGNAVVNYINSEDGERAVLVLSRDRTNRFLYDYADFFELYTGSDGKGILLKEGKNIEDLWSKFRSYLTFDILSAFVNKSNVRALGTCR